VKCGYNFKPDELDLVQECFAKGRKPLLLFPGDDSITIDQEDLSNQSSIIDDIALSKLRKEEQLLILIDGTWAEAKRMIMQSPDLVDSCIKVQFQSESESIYDTLRNEPEKHCLSTLECCARSLSHLEPSADVADKANEYLLASMQCMVDKRVGVSQSRESEPRFSRQGTKIFEKNKRRFEIKKELFQ
jgi:DTW domain-containing protein YfiP